MMSPSAQDGGREQQVDGFTRPLAVTFFQGAGASSKTEVSTTLLALAERIRNTDAPEKAKLPWLKLASFGRNLTDKGSLRHDRNVLSISGIEADYDAEAVSFEDAAERLLKAGLLSLLYTSPSHRPHAPRWRILCPLTQEMPPRRRDHYLGRLNGLFRGGFSTESWTLSQAYYFGAVNRSPFHRVEVIDGTSIDDHDDLDTTWMGKPGSTNSVGNAAGLGGRDAREDAELVRCIATGEHFHIELCALAARYVGRNIPAGTVEELLRGLMLSHPADKRDERWLDRYYSIPDLVASAAGKFRSNAAAQRRPVVRIACELVRARKPASEVRAAALAEGEVHGLPAEQVEPIVQWAARQELTRRGAGNGR